MNDRAKCGLSGNKRPIRHCERSEATQGVSKCGLVWVASLSLAMTALADFGVVLDGRAVNSAATTAERARRA